MIHAKRGRATKIVEDQRRLRLQRTQLVCLALVAEVAAAATEALALFEGEVAHEAGAAADVAQERPLRLGRVGAVAEALQHLHWEQSWNAGGGSDPVKQAGAFVP